MHASLKATLIFAIIDQEGTFVGARDTLFPYYNNKTVVAIKEKPASGQDMGV